MCDTVYEELLFLGKAVRDSVCIVLCLDNTGCQYSDFCQSYPGKPRQPFAQLQGFELLSAGQRLVLCSDFQALLMQVGC